MDTSHLTPKKMRKGKNGKRGTRYYDSTGALVAKTCPQCDEILPISEFNTTKQSIDGLFSTCRPCTSKAHKEYRDRDTVDTGKYQKSYRSRSDEELQETILKEFPTGAKECPQCHTEKGLDMFYQNKSYRSGVSPYCKKCTIARSKNTP